MRALVCNLFAGPGCGKSTLAALTFGKLKSRGYSVEMALEYAKDLTWEGRETAIRFQPYVTAKQMFRIHRLADKVDLVITDSPIPLGLVYQGRGCTPAFREFVLEHFAIYQNVNYLLRRNSQTHPYVQAGRSQTEAAAQLKDQEIRDMLDENGISWTPLPILSSLEATADLLVHDLLVLSKKWRN